MQENNSYKVGLPSLVRFRSQIVFGLLLFLFLSFSVSGIYAGIKTGRLEQVVIRPVASFVKSLETKKSDLSTDLNKYPSFTATSSSSVNIESNSKEANYQRSSDNNSKNVIYVYPTIAYKSYEELAKEQDEWWAKVQEQNKKLSEESQNNLEQFRLDSQKKMEEAEKAGQQGLLDFQKESERKMEEFRQKYGIQ